jgi:putative transcription factor
MECEICGKETKKIFIVEIEEAILRACEECSKGGRMLNIISESEKVKKRAPSYQEEDYDLVEGYGEIIEKARKKIGLSLEELAKRVGEKESLIRKIERGKIRPSDKLAEKLERILKIELRGKVECRQKENKKQVEGKLRIADVVKIKD